MCGLSANGKKKNASNDNLEILTHVQLIVQYTMLSDLSGLSAGFLLLIFIIFSVDAKSNKLEKIPKNIFRPKKLPVLQYKEA